MLFSVMKRATGVDLLKDLADFFNSFGDMADGFRERADRVNALIGDHRTTFLLVTSPARRVDRGGRLLPPQAAQRGPALRRRDREPDARAGEATPGPKLEKELTGLLDEKLAGKVNRTLDEHRAAGRARRREPGPPAAARSGASP